MEHLKPDPKALIKSYSECDWTTVAPLAAEARREKAIVAETQGTQWFSVHVDGTLAGCAGVILMPRSEARLKNHFITKDHRQKGLIKGLIRLSIRWCQERNLRGIHVFTKLPHMMAYYRSIGFRTVLTRPNGGLHMFLDIE